MANSASNISLNDVVSITLRRGIPITERQDPLHQKLAILNFSDEGPYALDGVLPVFIAPLSSIEQDQLASRFNFDLDALINRGEDPTIPVDGNNEGIITWRRLFSVDPESTADYSDVGWGLREGIQLDLFVNESLNIYRSLLAFSLMSIIRRISTPASRSFLSILICLVEMIRKHVKRLLDRGMITKWQASRM